MSTKLPRAQGVYNFTEKDRPGLDDRSRILLTVKDGNIRSGEVRAASFLTLPWRGRVDAKRRGGVKPHNDAFPPHPVSHFASLNVSGTSPSRGG